MPRVASCRTVTMWHPNLLHCKIKQTQTHTAHNSFSQALSFSCVATRIMAYQLFVVLSDSKLDHIHSPTHACICSDTCTHALMHNTLIHICVQAGTQTLTITYAETHTNTHSLMRRLALSHVPKHMHLCKCTRTETQS